MDKLTFLLFIALLKRHYGRNSICHGWMVQYVKGKALMPSLPSLPWALDSRVQTEGRHFWLFLDGHWLDRPPFLRTRSVLTSVIILCIITEHGLFLHGHGTKDLKNRNMFGLICLQESLWQVRQRATTIEAVFLVCCATVKMAKEKWRKDFLYIGSVERDELPSCAHILWQPLHSWWPLSPPC